jgi:SAM-dependent methyltransferase
MFGLDPKTEWEKFGREDPYYGVMVGDRFRKQNLAGPSLDDFFASGEEHIEYVMHSIRRFVDPEFSPRRSLDFGCGVGRCTIPLSRISREVIGTDIAESMLNEARLNCSRRGVANAVFKKTSDELSEIDGSFDLIHSLFTFAHIPRARGYRVFGALAGRLTDGGVGVVDFLIQRPRRSLWLGSLLRKHIPLVHNFANLMYGKPFAEPYMEKVVYGLNQVLTILRTVECTTSHVQTFANGNQLHALLFFRRGPERIPHESFAR